MTYLSRFFSSFSTASRMNSARLFGPATASILSGMPAGSLTTVGLTFNSGRPGPRSSTFFKLSLLKAISLIDMISDIAYQSNIRSRREQMTNAVFQANEVVTIRGYQQDCECSHCGRPLKVGVLLETFAGPFGAQCLAKAADLYTYNGRQYRERADSLKERAIIKGKGQACIDRHGLSDRNFRFTLKTELRSI